MNWGHVQSGQTSKAQVNLAFFSQISLVDTREGQVWMNSFIFNNYLILSIHPLILI